MQPSLLNVIFIIPSLTYSYILAVIFDLDQNTDQRLASTQFNNALVIGFAPKTAQRIGSNGSLSSWMICLLCRSGVSFTLPVNLSLVSTMKTTKLRREVRPR